MGEYRINPDFAQQAYAAQQLESDLTLLRDYFEDRMNLYRPRGKSRDTFKMCTQHITVPHCHKEAHTCAEEVMRPDLTDPDARSSEGEPVLLAYVRGDCRVARSVRFFRPSSRWATPIQDNLPRRQA